MSGLIIRCNTSNTKVKIVLDFFPICDIIRLSKGTEYKTERGNNYGKTQQAGKGIHVV